MLHTSSQRVVAVAVLALVLLGTLVVVLPSARDSDAPAAADEFEPLPSVRHESESPSLTALAVSEQRSSDLANTFTGTTRVAGERTATFRYRCVDELTGEPVREVNVTVRDRAADRVIAESVSDQDGFVRLGPDPVWLGTREVRARDRVSSIDTVIVVPPPLASPSDAVRTIDLPLAVGPTYRLSIEGYVGSPVDLVARLASCASSDGTKGFVEVRDADVPWVRLPLRCRNLRCDDRECVLEVRDRSGRYRGRARVESTVGIHAATVRILMTRSADLHGKVERPDGTPVQGAELFVRESAPPARSIEHEGPDDRWRTQRDGAYRLGGLTSGTVTVVCIVDGWLPLTKKVVLRAGETERVDFVLDPAFIGSTLSGHVTSRSRALDPRADHRVLLRKASERTVLAVAPVIPRRNSERDAQGVGRIGAFEFFGVPDGEYTIEAQALERGRLSSTTHYETLSPTLVVPESLEVNVHQMIERGSTAGFTFDVRDALTDAMVEPYTVVLGTSAFPKRFTQREWALPPTFGDRLYDLAPVHTDWRVFDWMVSAPGYVPHTGDRRVFTERVVGEKTLGAARVELQPGWGGIVYAVEQLDEEGRQFARLTDVEVMSGSDLLGFTDRLGAVFVQAQFEPKLLRARRANYETVDVPSSLSHLENGRPVRGQWTFVFVLRRR